MQDKWSRHVLLLYLIVVHIFAGKFLLFFLADLNSYSKSDFSWN